MLLRRTLESLACCRLPTGYKELIVVENGGKEGAEEIVRGAAGVLKARYVYEPKGNKSAALNSALASVGDSLIFFTDDDVRFDADVLMAYAESASECGAGFFFGGPVSVDYETEPPAWLREYLPKSAAGWEWTGERRRVETAEFLGFNWAAFARDIRAAGKFNINRGPGAALGSTGQESEMQRRLLQRGMRGAYVPSARVWHYVPRDRCSAEWAMARGFRHGVEEGARRATDAQDDRLSSPYQITRKRISNLVENLMWSCSRKLELRFRAKYWRNFRRGMHRGFRNERGAA
jgi:GT2 family glycosyltransferase